MTSSDALLAFTTRFAAFLELYRLGQWNLALERVSGLHSFTGILPVVGLVEAFERRLQELQVAPPTPDWDGVYRSEEHTSELQSLMRISYAVFCLKQKKKINCHLQHDIFHSTSTTTIYTNM